MSNDIDILNIAGLDLSVPDTVRTPQRMDTDEDYAAVVKEYASYVANVLQMDNLPTQEKSKFPLKFHAWVYAAVMVRALNTAQATLGVFTETEAAVGKRRADGIRKNGHWAGPRKHYRRRAMQRYQKRASRNYGFTCKDLEQDHDHPLNDLFSVPNPYLDGSMLIQLTSIWLSLRGECFWLLTDMDGGRVGEGQTPDQIWPLNPDQIKEVVIGGKFVGWKYSVGRNSVGAAQSRGSYEIHLEHHEVVQFKYVNPENPIRGLSPISAAASGVDQDLMVKSYNRHILKNGADPGGILLYDGHLDPGEEEAQREKWENRHSGPERTRRTALLKGGWKYQSIGLSPQDMQHLQTMQWNREEIFAVLRTPKTTVGITDAINYATQLGQDKNFWDKGLMPDIRLMEATLDRTVFHNEPDNVMALFDLSGIEALKQGMDDQLQMAERLVSGGLHMPPDVAFEVVGLEGIPDYPGRDVCLIAGFGMIPVQDVLDGVLEEPEPDVTDEPTEDPEPEETPEEIVPDTDEKRRTSKTSRNKASKPKTWKNFVAVQSELEKGMSTGWQKWIRQERSTLLAALDATSKSFVYKLSPDDKEFVDTVLTDLGSMKSRLNSIFSPQYVKSLEATYALVLDEIGGIAVFDVQDPRIVRAAQQRANAFIGSSPNTLRKRYRNTIIQGINQGETLGQLRQRVIDTSTTFHNPAKTLQVARTESASYMNGVRESMFDLQGFEQFLWINAGDEVVRASHAFFDNQGPQPKGTNYLELAGYPGSASGVLMFPGDPAAPTSEIINCRCVKSPIS